MCVHLHMCVHLCECGSAVPWYAYGDQRSTSDVTSQLLPFSFVDCCCTGQASWSMNLPYIIRVAGKHYCAQLYTGYRYSRLGY